jgi:hypothetical protein
MLKRHGCEGVTHLSPVDATTIAIIIEKVALSPVAILMIANIVRRQLKGLAQAMMKRLIAV